jgi:hypothetical protein
MLTYGGKSYIGIIQNYDDLITSLYDLSAIKTEEERIQFLELAEQWWWESHRKIPINLFLKSQWVPFKYSLKTFNSKDVQIVQGPCTSLKELAQKKTKKRSIVLVRKID